MLKNYFKVAWRNLMKKKMLSFINITGLTLGLAFAGLIGIYVYSNLAVDKTQPENLYRVTTAYSSDSKNDELNAVGRALVPAIIQEIPEVEKIIPVKAAGAMPVKHNNEYFFDNLAYAGEQFLTSFDFPMIAGDKATALREPYSIVLTEETAKKYFGSVNVIGQTLLLRDSILFTVKGVVKQPAPSHIRFDGLLSFSTFEKMGGGMNEWFVWDMTCYIVLKPGVERKLAEQKIAALSMKHNGDQYRQFGYNVGHKLEQAKHIYLQSSMAGFNSPKGSSSQLYILTIIGIALLLLACINFVNLTTAHQAERSVEVGVRKTMGARASSLVYQFMTETLVVVLLATLLAAGIIVLLLPMVEKLSGQSLPLSLLLTPQLIIGCLAVMILTTLLAGWYPSFLLARLSPAGSIKNQSRTERKGFTLRKALVVFQFTVSLVLIIGTIIATRQFNYIQNKDMGFEKDGTIVISMRNAPYKDVFNNYESIKDQLRKVAGVKSVAGSAGMPGKYAWDGQLVTPEGFPAEKTVTLEVIPSDGDYVKTLGVKMIAGRDFSPSFATDSKYGVLLNEAACQLIGWKPEDAIGKRVQTSGMDSGRVIGVMADYHQHGLQQKINPVLIFNAPYAYSYLAIATEGKNTQAVVSGIEAYWKQRFPGYPLKYTMLNEDLERQYAEETRLAKVINIFSVLTIFIAALGLFGLAAFITAQRTREIGIRKVLGASVRNVVLLVSKDFLWLVAAAIVIATPVAWWAGNWWLNDFAYRITVEWWMFAIAGVSAILIAILTVSYQTIKAALMNPIKSLRTD